MAERCKHPSVRSTPFYSSHTILEFVTLDAFILLGDSLGWIISGCITTLWVDWLVDTHVTARRHLIHWLIGYRHVSDTHVERVRIVELCESILTWWWLSRHWACSIESHKCACASREDELIMKLVVANLTNPMATVIIFKGKNRPVRLADVPDPDCTIRSASCQCMQSTSIVSNVKDLIRVCNERDVWVLSCFSHI